MAKRFAMALQKEGFEVWWDAHLRSGDHFDKVIETALQGAKAVVVLWSASSVDSRWVRSEAAEAQLNKTLFPALIEPCKRPIMFELTQATDLTQWNGKTSDKAWRVFVSDLRAFVGREEITPDGELPAPVASVHGGPELPAIRRQPLLFAAIAAAALVLLGGLYFAWGTGAGSGALSSQAKERTPVLVRGFAASGTGDRNEAALAGGITDELIVRLRRIDELQVGTADGTAAGSGAFEGAYIVDGNIRSNGDQLRVTARLTNAAGEILWTDTFDRKLGQLFELQEVIASNIASALSVSLDVGANSVAFGGTDNPEAYAAYMQFKINEFDFDQSVPIGYLKRAIALDPNYLKALSALSDSYSPRISYASNSNEADQLLAEMDASTGRMLAANPEMWMGHVSRAWYYLARRQFAGARREMELAQKFETRTDPELPGQLATLNYCLGYIRRASSLVQSAVIIDPLFRNDPRVIRDLVYTGKYQAAIDLFNKLVQDGNRGPLNHNLEVFWAYMKLGREAEAITFANRQAMRFGNEALAFKAEKGLSGMSLDALRQWAAARYGSGGHFQLANTAAFASHYGQQELAVKLLRLTFERAGAVGALTLWHPALAEARKTESFAKLMTDLGFVKLWRESGDWPDYCNATTDGGVACH